MSRRTSVDYNYEREPEVKERMVKYTDNRKRGRKFELPSTIHYYDDYNVFVYQNKIALKNQKRVIRHWFEIRTQNVIVGKGVRSVFISKDGREYYSGLKLTQSEYNVID